jgi:hypothetical protein
MTGPGDDARNPHQPSWHPPGQPPASDYPPDYPPLYPPPGAYYPPPQYPGGWGWGPAQPIPQPGPNGLAIASLVTAFAGFFCCIGSIVAIVLGTIALDQIKRKRQDGFGLAVAGIVLGVAGLIIALVIGIYAMQYH